MVFVLPRPTVNIGKYQLRKHLIRVLAAGLLVVPLILTMAGTGHAQESDDSDRADASDQAATNGRADANDRSDADGRAAGTGRAAGSTIAEHEHFDEQSRMAARDSGGSRASGVPGVDVSNWQGNIDWNAVAGDGVKFAYIKATGGTGYTDSKFDDNYVDSQQSGIIRGAYHFARPADSGGARQAKFFTENGGAWSADGKTMPPMLDVEYNPSGDDCYGLSNSQMVNWIQDFSDGVKQRSGRYPVIYTTTNWWKSCTGNSGAFKDTNPLMVASWGDSPGALPDWPYHTIWQHTSSGTVAGIAGEVDRDSFNGSTSQLKTFAGQTDE